MGVLILVMSLTSAGLSLAPRRFLRSSKRARAAAVAASLAALPIDPSGLWSTTASARSINGSTTGILLLAHGGSASWNATVGDLVRTLNATTPTELALGMAQRASIQAAVERLVARGVTGIAAVPLFVSSHSSVVESTRFLLGLRSDAPKDLAAFARMNHGGGGHSADGTSGTEPVRSPVPISLGSALDRDPLVGEILAARARAISREPGSEVVVLVAHGPVPDEDNERWLADMDVLAKQIASSIPFVRVDRLTVRDDAPPPVRDAATAVLRETVGRASTEGHRVLVVPQLLSYGGIEQGIRKRLDGLDYVMAPQAIMPDSLVERWVLKSAGFATR